MELKTNSYATKDILSEITDGLSGFPKTLPYKLFYNNEGSDLFDQICNLKEYYLTRKEMEIMTGNIKEIADLLGEDITLIELGSGNSRKTRLLFDNLSGIKTYIPVDISDEYLHDSVASIKKDYPSLNVIPKCHDYTADLKLQIQEDLQQGRRIVFFPGSTIGNFTPFEARDFLFNLLNIIGSSGGILIGVDLKKKKELLQMAYNDNKGITAKFNLNILKRLNDEFCADFNLENFRHKALYNETEGRIEMYLISLTDQSVKLCNSTFSFKKNEKILTEYSYKYNVDEFKELLKDKLRLKRAWIDNEKMFSVQYFEPVK
ncbi:MAG: L-histidine N(alpha)-methyltransferase [Bacteroidota bacterium]|nr:L-histidine N(alpha)-methyltransferase [Bacteroidota bacterium]MDP4189955.1 L-histidine N(alpha)-methyltransferase [Bacteroidota bacterium]MDP4194488.1 L-histidine N(alpha)-methyltransferase [Bacteroidota bacterium]